VKNGGGRDIGEALTIKYSLGECGVGGLLQATKRKNTVQAYAVQKYAITREIEKSVSLSEGSDLVKKVEGEPSERKDARTRTAISGCRKGITYQAKASSQVAWRSSVW
jgi:hypothetical protein